MVSSNQKKVLGAAALASVSALATYYGVGASTAPSISAPVTSVASTTTACDPPSACAVVKLAATKGTYASTTTLTCCLGRLVVYTGLLP